MKNFDTKGKKPNLLKVEYSVAPFSGVERRKTSKFDKYLFDKKTFIKIFHREWSEFAENLRFCFEKLLCSENYSKSQILIIVSVLESDGSTKSAIFNAVSLALIDAGFL